MLHSDDDSILDHTREAGFYRLRRHLTDEEAEKYIESGRYRARIIKYVPHASFTRSADTQSVWRPLSRPIEDSPLAFCDFRTLSENDLVAAGRVAEEYAGEIYYVLSNPRQR